MQAVMSTNGLKKQLENWNEINWRQVNKLVKNLRQRIFRARELGNFRAFEKLAEVDAKKLRKPIIIRSTYYPNQ